MSNTKWNLETCLAEAKAFTTRSAWSQYSFGSYDCARINGWLDVCCAHMDGAPRKVKWSVEAIMNEAKKYTSRWEWSQRNGTSYQAAKKLGIFEACCSHMQKPWKHKTRQTDEEIKQRRKEHYERNKEAILARRKLWFENNKPRLLEYQARYRDLNREKRRVNQREQKFNKYYSYDTDLINFAKALNEITKEISYVEKKRSK